MHWISIVILSLLFGSKLIQYLITRRQNNTSDELMEFNRKHDLKTLIEEREERLDLTEFSEVEFWKMMEEVQSRSKSSFKNSMGVFKDLIKRYNPEELVQLDNLLIRLFRDYLNYDIYAASRIIFNTNHLGATLVLMHLLMTKGQVFFNQACVNPNLIIGKEFTDIRGGVFHDVIADVYYSKTLKLIPDPISIEDEELKISGKKWTEKELPSRYEELWFAYC